MDPGTAQLGAIGDLWTSIPQTLRRLNNKLLRLQTSPDLFAGSVELVTEAEEQLINLQRIFNEWADALPLDEEDSTVWPERGQPGSTYSGDN